MYLEVVGFWGLICLIMFALAEYSRKNVTIGIIGGVLLVLLGAWLLAEQIQIKTGESTIITQNITTAANGSITYSPSVVTQTNTYTGATAGFFNLNQTLGIIFMLIGLWAAFKYSMALNEGD